MTKKADEVMEQETQQEAEEEMDVQIHEKDEKLSQAGKNLVKKLAEVMLEVRYVRKTGNNAFQKYTYATERDIAQKIRIALAKRFVILVPSLTGYSTRELETKKNGKVTIYTVDMQFTFMDGESGEQITFHITGEGQDQMEKGIYKAYTGAQKYALMKFFMLPTGDEPEEDNSEVEVTGSQPGQRSQLKHVQPDLQSIQMLVSEIAKSREQEEQLKGVIQKKMGLQFRDYDELSPEQQLTVSKVLTAIRDKKASGQ